MPSGRRGLGSTPSCRIYLDCLIGLVSRITDLDSPSLFYQGLASGSSVTRAQLTRVGWRYRYISGCRPASWTLTWRCLAPRLARGCPEENVGRRSVAPANRNSYNSTHDWFLPKLSKPHSQTDTHPCCGRSSSAMRAATGLSDGLAGEVLRRPLEAIALIFSVARAAA